jgi:hypothetical protein
MMLLLSQIVVTALLFAILFIWVRGQRKQRKQSADTWESLVSQLHGNEWGLEEISERYLYGAGITATSEDIWARIDGANGLWAMYKNTSVLLKLADYAAEHGDSTNETLVEALRADAFAIRLSVISALLKYAFSRSTIGASVNAHRATTAYTEMLFHLTTLFQEHSAQLFPRYLQAM